ncbi:MAG TPA: VWA domain-containing protein [Edaphobacter sp.]|nr:VWA domain-containing protein [Edaphobacter sp.]
MLRVFKCLLGSASTTLVLATLTSAQTPQPSQPPATQQPSQSGVATLRAGTQLVVVDVVVTDKNQRPIHGLKASDFTLTEENAPQTIKHFEEHTALTPADATKFPALPKFPPGVFTNYTPAPVNGAVNLLLLDALNTPVRDQAYVRQQLLAYLNATPPGTRIAIFGLTTQLTILQGFTSDPEILKAVTSSKLGKNSPLLQDSVGGGGIQNSTADNLEDAGADATTVANLRQFDAQQQSFQLQLRVKYTLDAMNQLARYLSSIPGRKNLIWFSGSFPISVLPDTTGNLTDPFAVVADYEKEFRETVNLLARSQVAVYPVDARGLTNAPVFDASTSRNYAAPGRGTARMTQDLNKFSTDTAAEHSTMSQMAEATGGHAFYNTNGLTQAVATAINDGSNFYTLTYTPSNPPSDGKFRKIKVQLAQGGVNLAYRHGYYADDPYKSPSAATNGQPQQTKVADSAVTSATPNPLQAMRVAMMRGSPTPTEIIMKVAVLPTGPSTQTEDTPAPNNILSEKVHGPFRRYSVSYAIEPADITFLRAPDGKIHAAFELIIFVFKPEGVLVNRLSTQLRIASPLDELKKNVARGIQYRQEISAPAKGEYFLRIVVHDLTQDRLGAVEVATSEVKNLQPPTAPPPAPTPPVSPAVEQADTPTVPK